MIRRGSCRDGRGVSEGLLLKLENVYAIPCCVTRDSVLIVGEARHGDTSVSPFSYVALAAASAQPRVPDAGFQIELGDSPIRGRRPRIPLEKLRRPRYIGRDSRADTRVFHRPAGSRPRRQREEERQPPLAFRGRASRRRDWPNIA